MNSHTMTDTKMKKKPSVNAITLRRSRKKMKENGFKRVSLRIRKELEQELKRIEPDLQKEYEKSVSIIVKEDL